MKRFTILLFVIFFSSVAFSAPVGESMARKIAGLYLEQRRIPLSKAGITLLADPLATKSDIDPFYYVYRNGDSGFVIISGDDTVSPIIGYSDNNGIDLASAPENFRYWMGCWEKIIKSNRSNAVKASAAVAKEWEALKSGQKVITVNESGYGSKLYETARWAQDDPYNAYCPELKGQKCVTGCVATAICIVMRYNRWPESINANLEGYTCKSGATVDPITANHAYNWDLMPLVYDEKSTQEQKDEVARLMSEVGSMVKMNYGLSADGGSSSNYSYALKPFNQYLQYDKSSKYVSAQWYDSATWLKMLIKNIEEYGPTLYDGQSNSGGHAFVADGYQDSGMIHINWGWGDYGGGYYTYPDIGDYKNDQGAVFGLSKEHGGQESETISVTYYSGWSYSPGISVKDDHGIKKTKFLKGDSFKAYVNAIEHRGLDDFEGIIALVVVDKNDNIIDIVAQDPTAMQNGYIYLEDFDATLNINPSLGDCLAVAYKSKITPEWTLADVEVANSRIVGRYPIADQKTIDQSTSVTYSVKNKMLTLSSKAGVNVQILSPEGQLVQEWKDVNEGTPMNLDCSALPAGSYKVSMTKKDELKEFTLKIGQQQ